MQQRPIYSAHAREEMAVIVEGSRPPVVVTVMPVRRERLERLGFAIKQPTAS
ncbi:MAG TPA: hypothetical protein VFX49_22555 [Chloroflexota bacterium]|nr:hypothetical protein [Chloroflexota bacterium]